MQYSGKTFADNEGDGDMPRTYSELYISVRNRLRGAGIEAAELEGKLMPIMQKAYQNAAGGAGGMPGGMPGGIDPNMFNQGGAGPSAGPTGGHSGPRVEEVD